MTAIGHEARDKGTFSGQSARMRVAYHAHADNGMSWSGANIRVAVTRLKPPCFELEPAHPSLYGAGGRSLAL